MVALILILFGKMHLSKIPFAPAKVRAGGLDWVDGSVDKRFGAALSPKSEP